MYYFKYYKIYSKYNKLNYYLNVNYRLNRAVKNMLNKSLK